MGKNCLITLCSEKVANESILKVGELRYAYSINENDTMKIQINNVPQSSIILSNSNGSFYNLSGVELGNSVKAEGYKTFYLHGPKEGYISISNKYNLTALQGLEYVDKIDLCDFIYTKLTDLQITKAPNITGDLSSLSNLTNLTKLYLKAPNITGDLSSLSNLTKLTDLQITKAPNITGDLSDALSNLTSLSIVYISSSASNVTCDINKFVTNQIKAGRTSGKVQFLYLRNCKYTYNGKSTSNINILSPFVNWTSDGTITLMES